MDISDRMPDPAFGLEWELCRSRPKKGKELKDELLLAALLKGGALSHKTCWPRRKGQFRLQLSLAELQRLGSVGLHKDSYVRAGWRTWFRPARSTASQADVDFIAHILQPLVALSRLRDECG